MLFLCAQNFLFLGSVIRLCGLLLSFIGKHTSYLLVLVLLRSTRFPSNENLIWNIVFIFTSLLQRSSLSSHAVSPLLCNAGGLVDTCPFLNDRRGKCYRKEMEIHGTVVVMAVMAEDNRRRSPDTSFRYCHRLL